MPRAYTGGMTTFAGQMDFSGPQPFNVSIEAEDALCQPPREPVMGAAVPLVLQEITPDYDLYRRLRYGVKSTGRNHR